jgi:hypothetical protein
MKLILLFNVIPLDFNEPVTAFHKFFNSVRKKFFGYVFNQFCTAPIFLGASSPQMKLGCIITNRRVKLRAWLGNARHHPWLRNSEVSHQPVRLCLHLFGDMEGVILVHFTPRAETVNRTKTEARELKTGAVQNWLQAQ